MRSAIVLLSGAVLLSCVWLVTQGEPEPEPEPPAGQSSALAMKVDASGLPHGNAAREYLSKLTAAESRSSGEAYLLAYKPTPGLAGRIALEEIFFKGVRPTPAAATAGRALLNGGQLSDDERIAMINIVARLHNRENTTGLNAQIEADMRALAADSNKNIAHDAAMFYARFGYAEDTQAILDSALSRGAMVSEDYFRELAHLLPSAPNDKKRDLILRIQAGSSELGTDILTESLLSGEDFNAAPFLRDSEDMAKLLAGMEPNLGSNVAQYGMVDVIRYRNWLRATALLESQKTGESMEAVVVRHLSEPGTDPRKIMGYLSAPEARPMLASAGVDSPVQDLVRVAQRNADQHPASRDMHDVVSEIRLRMKAPPPVPPPAVFERTMPIGGPVPSQGGQGVAGR